MLDNTAHANPTGLNSETNGGADYLERANPQISYHGNTCLLVIRQFAGDAMPGCPKGLYKAAVVAQFQRFARKWLETTAAAASIFTTLTEHLAALRWRPYVSGRIVGLN
jgi:hypothetical protein